MLYVDVSPVSGYRGLFHENTVSSTNRLFFISVVRTHHGLSSAWMEKPASYWLNSSMCSTSAPKGGQCTKNYSVAYVAKYCFNYNTS